MQVDEKKVREIIKLLYLSKVEESYKRVFEAKRLLQSMLPKQKYEFYRNQPVLVRNSENDLWERFTLVKILPGENYYVVKYPSGSRTVWSQCKPDLEANSIINWIRHDGGMGVPESVSPSNRILFKDTRGVVSCILIRKLLNWKEIVWYAVIEQLEFLNEKT